MRDFVRFLLAFGTVVALLYVGRAGAIEEYRRCRFAKTAEDAAIGCPGWVTSEHPQTYVAVSARSSWPYFVPVLALVGFFGYVLFVSRANRRASRLARTAGRVAARTLDEIRNEYRQTGAR